MRAKHNYITSIFCLIIVFFQYSLFGASSNTLHEEFKFYHIGPEDSKDTAEKKSMQMDFNAYREKPHIFILKPFTNRASTRKKQKKLTKLLLWIMILKNLRGNSN